MTVTATTPAPKGELWFAGTGWYPPIPAMTTCPVPPRADDSDPAQVTPAEQAVARSTGTLIGSGEVAP
jgi:hypothetical protein